MAKLHEWLAKRRKETAQRAEETVGGGFIVFRIDAPTGRVAPSPIPFEHSGYNAALAAAVKLSNKHAGMTFSVYMEMARVTNGVPVERG